jgi:hypothetical protein
MRLVKPDLLVVDLRVPGSGAWVLIAALRALKPERGGMVPAIAIGRSLSDGDHWLRDEPVEPAEPARLATRLVRPG